MSKIICDSKNRITYSYNEYEHNGVDLGWRLSENQNKVYAHSSGVVISVVDGLGKYPYNDKSMNTYGNYVDIDHGNGYKTRYAHLRKGTVMVFIGQHVDASTQLAVIGESGYVTARHLHFEVFKDGKRINPEPFLSKDFFDSDMIDSNSQLLYQSFDSVYKWNPNVIIGGSDYAGNFGINMEALYLDKYKMRVHDMIKREWLPWVTDRQDYAGNIGNAIDGIQIEGVIYRVHLKNRKWLPWVYKSDNTSSGYAGIYGYPIDAVQIKFK